MRTTLLLGLMMGLTTLGVEADPRSGPRRQTLLERPWGTVYCAETCAVQPDPARQRIKVTTPEGPIAILQLEGGWIQVQAPDGSVMRVRSTDTGGTTEILVQLNKANYRIFKRYGEVEWKFPEDHIYFKTMDGNLRDILGTKGTVSVRRNFQRQTFVVENQEGASEYKLEASEKVGKSKRKDKAPQYTLKLVDGQPLTQYPYLLRGVTFELGTVGFFLPLTSGKFTNALEWDRVQSFRMAVTAFQPGKKDPPPPSNDPTADDPLNLKLRSTRRQFKAPDPLKAGATPVSEDQLKVKSIDPSAPNP